LTTEIFADALAPANWKRLLLPQKTLARRAADEELLGKVKAAPKNRV
jgi:hypothetical protein